MLGGVGSVHEDRVVIVVVAMLRSYPLQRSTVSRVGVDSSPGRELVPEGGALVQDNIRAAIEGEDIIRNHRGDDDRGELCLGLALREAALAACR